MPAIGASAADEANHEGVDSHGLTAGSRRTSGRARVPRLVLILAIVACAGGRPRDTLAHGAATPTTAPTTTPRCCRPAAPRLRASCRAAAPPSPARRCARSRCLPAALGALTGLDLESAAVRDVLGASLDVTTDARSSIPRGPCSARSTGARVGAFRPPDRAPGITGKAPWRQGRTIENAVDEVAAAFDALKAEVAPGCPAPKPPEADVDGT